MKRSLLVAWLCGQVFFLAGLYFALNAGVAAQRTHNYSLLRELEMKGLLATNASFVMEYGQPGQGFVAMKPIRSFHTLGLVISSGWALVSLALLAASLRSKSKRE